MIDINFIFSIGYRCYSPDFLKKYNIRNISGPFDYLFIDIETVFENIYNNFEYFLKDIVLINKKNNIANIYYSNSNIHNKIIHFKNNLNIGYMRDNYNNLNILFNQNFLNNTPNNLYNWDRICIFHHHNILEKHIYNKIKQRIQIFKNIYIQKKNKLCLFYITKIIEETNLSLYKKNILLLKQKYNINCYIIIIICSDKHNDSYIFENDILYIIKKVDNYYTQYNTYYGTDNNLDYQNEFSIINKFFNMNLYNYNQIYSQFLPIIIKPNFINSSLCNIK